MPISHLYPNSYQQSQTTLCTQQNSSTLIYHSNSSQSLLTGSLHSLKHPIVSHQNLLKTIDIQNSQIKTLTSLLQHTKYELQMKTLQVQSLILQTQNVAQKLNKIIILQSQNQRLQQKLTLFQQVNTRQYQQTLTLQKQKNSLYERIQQMKKNMKGQQSSSEMRLAETRMELVMQKRRNSQLQKQVTKLKAIIKQLQDDLDQQDNQKSFRYCINCGNQNQKNDCQKAKQSVFTNLSIDLHQNQQNISNKSQNNQSKSESSNNCYILKQNQIINKKIKLFDYQTQQIQFDIENSIVFM